MDPQLVAVANETASLVSVRLITIGDAQHIVLITLITATRRKGKRSFLDSEWAAIESPEYADGQNYDSEAARRPNHRIARFSFQCVDCSFLFFCEKIVRNQPSSKVKLILYDMGNQCGRKSGCGVREESLGFMSIEYLLAEVCLSFCSLYCAQILLLYYQPERNIQTRLQWGRKVWGPISSHRHRRKFRWPISRRNPSSHSVRRWSHTRCICSFCQRFILLIIIWIWVGLGWHGSLRYFNKFLLYLGRLDFAKQQN